jgi:CHAT domain-containing protein
LPIASNRSIAVAPSVASWLRALDRRRPSSTAALVAGPDLVAADDELTSVAAFYRQPTVLGSTVSTVEGTLDAFADADVGHIAAHGRFREDNPMFSSLLVGDGAMTVYDLEQLPSAPSVVVLSACDVGRSIIRPGNEIVGVVSAFLSLGTATLIASVLPVADELATKIAIAFHLGLTRGRAPGLALAEAQLSASPDATTPIAPFLCFGAG